MFFTIIGIAALLLAGAYAIWKVVLTLPKLINKIKEKFALKKAKKVAVADLNELINTCTNKVSCDALEKWVDKGCTQVVASINKDNKISDLELIEDESASIDEEVDEYINGTGDGIVVIKN